MTKPELIAPEQAGGGSYERDPKTGKLKRLEPALVLPEPGQTPAGDEPTTAVEPAIAPAGQPAAGKGE